MFKQIIARMWTHLSANKYLTVIVLLAIMIVGLIIFRPKAIVVDNVGSMIGIEEMRREQLRQENEKLRQQVSESVGREQMLQEKLNNEKSERIRLEKRLAEVSARVDSLDRNYERSRTISTSTADHAIACAKLKELGKLREDSPCK